MPLPLLFSPYSIAGFGNSTQAPQTVTATGTNGSGGPLLTVIPAYVYQQYAENENIQALFAANNACTQLYLDWYNQNPLSVYTSPNIYGPLLDWIMQGVYGIARPVFSNEMTVLAAGLGENPLATVPLGGNNFVSAGTAIIATDDYYKRVGTWALYLGDGRQFSIPVLRRKVARFLFGVDGADISLSLTQQISIQSQEVNAPPAPWLSTTPLSPPAGGCIGALGTFAFGTLALGDSWVDPVQVWTTLVTAQGETNPSPASAIPLPTDKLLVVQSPPPAPVNTRPFYLGAFGTRALGLGALGTGGFVQPYPVENAAVLGWNVYTLVERAIASPPQPPARTRYFYLGALGTGAFGTRALGETVANPPYPVIDPSVSTVRFFAGLGENALGTVCLGGGIITRTTALGRRQNPVTLPIGPSWTEPATGFVRGILLPSENTSVALGAFILTVPSTPASSTFQQAMNQGVLAFPFQLSAKVVIA